MSCGRETEANEPYSAFSTHSLTNDFILKRFLDMIPKEKPGQANIYLLLRCKIKCLQSARTVKLFSYNTIPAVNISVERLSFLM